jgi:hypothetical protein
LKLPIQPHEIEEYPVVIYKKNEIFYLRFESFTIGTNEIDNCALLTDQSVVFVLALLKENDIIYIRAKRFLNLKPFFNTPCSSERLGIFVISNTTNGEIIQVPAMQIKRKCVKIKLMQEIDSYVTIPLQSQNN